MNSAVLNLLVLRSPQIERLAEFYSVLGFVFAPHQHGSGPEHLCASNDGLVLEIYPQRNHDDSTSALRFGFAVPCIETALSLLHAVGGRVVTPASDSEWGRRAVIKDIEGHTVELVEISGNGR